MNAAIEDGRNVVAVLTENDEAVLVSNRLGTALPVVDDVDVRQLLSATLDRRRGAPGSVAPLQHLTDPFWLAEVFSLRDDERVDARVVADRLFDSACAVVSLDSSAPARDTPPLRTSDSASKPVDRPDWFIPYIWQILRHKPKFDDGIGHRRQCGDGHHGRCRGPPAGADELGEALGVDVTRIDLEAAAARVGAVTTPGVTDDVVVVDIGGGTVDVVTNGSRVVLPGAGQLLTTATSSALDISRSAAEYAKRAEAVTAVTVQLVEDEHGRRQFLDKPISGRCTGWLLTSAPSGLLPFTSRMSGTEWRSWRLAAKRLVIGGNVMRRLEQVAPGATGVLLVGGEPVTTSSSERSGEQLGHQVSVGRGNVGGRLGHRFAVASRARSHGDERVDARTLRFLA